MCIKGRNYGVLLFYPAPPPLYELCSLSQELQPVFQLGSSIIPGFNTAALNLAKSVQSLGQSFM